MKSIVTEYTEISAFSQNPKECDHHLIFGSGLRKLAEEDGLFIPLTNKEHNMGQNTERIHGNQAAEKLSKMLGQVTWEKEYYRSIWNPSMDSKRERILRGKNSGDGME